MPYEYPKPPAPPKTLLPRPALGNPALERAADALRKAYPRDMSGVDIVPDWSEYMVTNRAGGVRADQPNTIHVNALRAALAPQELVEATGAHELEHVRQLRDPQRREQLRSGMQMPYEQRAHEHAAEDAAQRYRATRPRTFHDDTVTGVSGRFFYDLGETPAVKELLNWINTR